MVSPIVDSYIFSKMQINLTVIRQKIMKTVKAIFLIQHNYFRANVMVTAIFI